MARFIKGDVVVLNFPFSDLTRTKRRPALVITALTGDDVILCQITSQVKFDSYAIKAAGFARTVCLRLMPVSSCTALAAFPMRSSSRW